LEGVRRYAEFSIGFPVRTTPKIQPSMMASSRYYVVNGGLKWLLPIEATTEL